MSEFRPALAFLLPHEGGYVCDPDDQGGATNCGISQWTYPHLDIKNLTAQEISDLYFTDWWQKYPFAQLNDQNVANKLFDMAVNMGTHQAVTLFQRAINGCGPMVLCDGHMGPVTLAAANGVDPVALLEGMREEAERFYRTLAIEKPSNAKFLDGWLERARA